MQKLKRALPPLALLALLVLVWWVVVITTQSLIFPTPWQVLSGAGELAANGTLWQHIGASLFRVASGFSKGWIQSISSSTGTDGSMLRSENSSSAQGVVASAQRAYW